MSQTLDALCPHELDNATAPPNGDPALFQAVGDVGEDPPLHPPVELTQKVHHGDAGADPAQLERRLHRAVAAAHHDNALLPVGMRLHEEVRYVREILPGDAERVGRLEVAGREHQVTARDGLWLRAPGVLRYELEPVSR